MCQSIVEQIDYLKRYSGCIQVLYKQGKRVLHVEPKRTPEFQEVHADVATLFDRITCLTHTMAPYT